MAQLCQRGLYLDIGRIPLQRFIEIALGLGIESGPFADHACIFEVRGVDRLALHGRLDGLHGLAHHRGDAGRGEGEVVERLRILRIVLGGHVEVLVGGADVVFLPGLDAFGEVGLGNGREVGGGLRAAAGQFGIVLPPLGRIGQHVHRLGERLELPLGAGLVPSAITVGVVFPRQRPETLADLDVRSGPLDPENLVVVDLHSGLVLTVHIELFGYGPDDFRNALVVLQAFQIT